MRKTMLKMPLDKIVFVSWDEQTDTGALLYPLAGLDYTINDIIRTVKYCS